MCGIAGIYAYREAAPPVDRDELLRIREAMIRRGPDGAGLWVSSDQRIGLAHRRLAIIDLSEAGAQPMATADGRFRITFNGEIYNYRTLRKELEAKGYRFHSNSDTEVLLHLYADRGEAMVHALRGMYAFGIWDKYRKGLFLARDPFGIKPLYYSDDGSTLRFASQVKALLRGGGIESHPEAAGYVGFLIWGCVPEPFTLYREIRALPAGTHLWVDANGNRRQSAFFRVGEEFTKAEAAAAEANAGNAQQALRALQDSVRHHLIADVPVAAFLSAGLDSATLVASAAAVSGADVRTLTLGSREYQGSENDETELAQTVAARYGLEHETRWVTRKDFEADLDAILGAMDQPTTDGVNTFLVSKAAANVNMKVALSGLGGDELLGGYPSFTDVPRIRRAALASHMPSAAGTALRKMTAPLLKRFASPKYAGLLEYGQTFPGAYLLRRGLFMPWELPEIVDAEMAVRGWEDLHTLSGLDASIRGLGTDKSIVSTLELDWYMRNQLLRDSDWAGMAHSVEIRLPYVDVPLFRSIARIACDGSPLAKIDLARALNPSLPKRVIERRKTGFLVPVREWCDTTAVGGAKERGLRGWAKIVIQDSLAATGSRAMRPGTGRVFSRLVPPAHAGSAPVRKVGRTGAGNARGGAPLWDNDSAAVAFRSSHPLLHRLTRRAQAVLILAAYHAINGTLRGAAVVLWPRRRPVTAARVCVFRIGNIGDIVCALPAIRAVRQAYPDAHLTLLTSPGRRGMPGATEVLEGVRWIDEVRVYHADDIDTYPKRSTLLREMRAHRFDVWVDIPDNRATLARQLRDIAFTRMAGPRWARGWQIDTLAWAAQAQSEYLRFANEVDRTKAAVARIGFATSDEEFGLPRPAHTVARIDALLRERGIDASRLVGIAPGAKRSTNLWNPERFAQVGQQLSRNGYTMLLIAGKAEEEACRSIAAQIGVRAQSFAGDLTVAESCELLRRCSLLICLDSGVQHLASAVGTPCVSLFSFWQMRGKWHPYGMHNVVLQKWVRCHTCLIDECPNGNRCMNAIETGEVTEHALAVLAAGRNRGAGRMQAHTIHG